MLGGMTPDEQSDAFRILQRMIRSLRNDESVGPLRGGTRG
jgi:hypothetical protein